MNRREALKSLAGGSALGLTVALIVASTSCAPTEVPAAETTIEAMYAEWRALHYRDLSGESEEDSDRIHAIYLDLQSRIIAATPMSPRDVALQFWCDTGCGECDASDVVYEAMRNLAEPGGGPS